MTGPGLPFFDFSEEQRQKVAHLIQSKPFTERARRFLQLAFTAATDAGPPGLRVRYYDATLLVSCPQERLAELLDCNVRTVQRMVDDESELVRSGVLENAKTVPETDGPPVQKTVYLIFLDVLESLPSLDPTDELDSIILDRNGRLRSDKSRRFEHPENDVGSGVGSDVGSGVMCPVGSVVGSNVGSPMIHDHVNTHEIKTHDHDHEHGDQRSILSWKKGVLQDSDVRRIVSAIDYATILHMDAEGCSAFNWPKNEQDRLQRIAMWHHCATNRKLDSSAAVLKRRMQDGDRKCLTNADLEWASQLLRIAARATNAISQCAERASPAVIRRPSAETERPAGDQLDNPDLMDADEIEDQRRLKEDSLQRFRERFQTSRKVGA